MTAPTTTTASFASTSTPNFESQDGSGDMMNMPSLDTVLAALGGNSAVSSASTTTTSSTPPTSTTDLGGDPPVADLPELPAEIWALIWPLVAAQIGFVGARRLMGGAMCRAAREGWGCVGSLCFYNVWLGNHNFEADTLT